MKRVKDRSPEAFERNAIVLISLICAAILIYLGIKGPMFLGDIVYKTHPTVNNQLIAQDFVNVFAIAPILIIGAFALSAKKRYSKYLLILTPLFLMYYAISYALGWEWMAPNYSGNSEHYFFYYLAVLISAMLIMMYCLSAFSTHRKPHFSKRPLVIYSTCFAVFMSLFGMMWMKEIFTVFATGTARGYDLSPTAFWLVRTFDLGFSIPLGFISLYLLWVRPASSFPLQMLIYGFFLSMSVVVCAMAGVMYFNNDPSFEPASSAVFVILMAIVFGGYYYILKSYSKPKHH